MRKHSKAGAEENSSEIDLTPMLDVVFIMLIFFIVTASFIKEAGVEVNRPDASTSSKKENVNILIAVTGTNEIWIDKRRVDKRAVRSKQPSRLWRGWLRRSPVFSSIPTSRVLLSARMSFWKTI